MVGSINIVSLVTGTTAATVRHTESVPLRNAWLQTGAQYNRSQSGQMVGKKKCMPTLLSATTRLSSNQLGNAVTFRVCRKRGSFTVAEPILEVSTEH